MPLAEAAAKRVWVGNMVGCCRLGSEGFCSAGDRSAGESESVDWRSLSGKGEGRQKRERSANEKAKPEASGFGPRGHFKSGLTVATLLGSTVCRGGRERLTVAVRSVLMKLNVRCS